MVFSKNYRFFTLFLLVLLGGLVLSLSSLAGDRDKDSKTNQPGLVIKNNKLAGSGFGVYVGPRDEEVLIKGNTITGNAEGIRLTGVKKENLLIDNRIIDNLAGITLRDRYSDNKKGFIKYPVNPENIKIRSNEFSGNEAGNILNFLEETTNKSGTTARAASSSSEKTNGSRSEASTEGNTGSKAESRDSKSVSGQNDQTQNGQTEAKNSSPEAEGSGALGSEGSSKPAKSTEKSESEIKEPQTSSKKESAQPNPDTAENTGVVKDEGETHSIAVESGSPSGEEGAKEVRDLKNNVEKNSLENSHEVGSDNKKKVSFKAGNPYVIAGAAVVGLTTLLLVLKSSL